MAQFMLGKLYSTCGISEMQKQEPEFVEHVMRSLKRYTRCDWGEMSDEDKEMNDMAIGPNEDRVFAAYEHADHPDWKIWVITESDRSCTTILFPDEY